MLFFFYDRIIMSVCSPVLMEFKLCKLVHSYYKVFLKFLLYCAGAIKSVHGSDSSINRRKSH